MTPKEQELLIATARAVALDRSDHGLMCRVHEIEAESVICPRCIGFGRFCRNCGGSGPDECKCDEDYTVACPKCTAKGEPTSSPGATPTPNLMERARECIPQLFRAYFSSFPNIQRDVIERISAALLLTQQETEQRVRQDTARVIYKYAARTAKQDGVLTRKLSDKQASANHSVAETVLLSLAEEIRIKYGLEGE